MLCCGKNRKFGSLNKFRGFFFISKVLIWNSNKQPCLKNLFQRKGSQSLRWTFLIIGNSSKPQFVSLLGYGTMTMTIILKIIFIIKMNTTMILKIWTIITISMTRSLSSSRIIIKIIVTVKNITKTMVIMLDIIKIIIMANNITKTKL